MAIKVTFDVMQRDEGFKCYIHTTRTESII
jgi:hypothetical protein